MTKSYELSDNFYMLKQMLLRVGFTISSLKYGIWLVGSLHQFFMYFFDGQEFFNMSWFFIKQNNGVRPLYID